MNLPACVHITGEGALKSAQLELQLQARKQEAEVELVQAKLQQQAAALVSAKSLTTSATCIVWQWLHAGM
jgi:hypothetical protein